MDAFLGTFAVGDNIHTARLAPKTDDGEDWGDGMGTGWTAELEIHRSGVAAVLVTVTGTAETVAEAAYLFVLGDIGLLAPASPATTVEYDAYLKLTKASSVYIGGPEGDVRTPFKFTIRDTAPLMQPTPGKVKLPLWPFRGFCNSKPRDEVGLDQMTGASRNWLVTRGRLRRRPGTAIYGDTLSGSTEVAGILETAIGFLARRLIPALLASAADLFPTPLVLFTEEATTGAATLAWYSTGAAAWRNLGDNFDATSYPDTGRVAFRCMPMVYENVYGGLTLHRLNSATHRQYACAGSRSLLEQHGQICWGGYTSSADRWNGRSGAVGATANDDDCLEIFPLGLIPPLQVPACTKGTSLGASTPGPFKGSEAWFYTVIFEDENGELSGYPIPRPPGSAWSGYAGFGYFQVDSTNPTYFYDSVVYSGIADGPPGTRFKHLARSTKVDVATTGAGAVVQPSVRDLNFFARIPQGVTTYVDSDGNDLALDPDPRIQDIIKRGLQWARNARHIGRFDGHTTLGDLKTCPWALLVAPWENGSINAGISDASLYVTPYGVAVTPEYLLLRKVGATTVAKVGATLSGSPIIGLPDLRNVEAGKAITGAGIPGATTISNLTHLIDAACATTDGSVTVTVTNSALNRVGQLVEGPGIPVGATVATIPGGGVTVTLSLPATVTDAVCTLRFTQATLSANASATATGVTFTITADATDTAVPLEGETLRSIVDRVNSDASVVNTTFTGAQWTIGLFSTVIDLNAAPTGVYLGDLVISSAYPAGTVVTIIEGSVGAEHIRVNNFATRSNTGGGESITIQHRSAGTSITYAAGVVPGSDADEDANELLRTRVEAHATFGSADTTLELLDLSLAEHVTPGMAVSGTNLPATALVTAVNTTTGVVTISAASTGTGTNAVVIFYYDTADETSCVDKGYVRAFGNAFPARLPWRMAYLGRFRPNPQATIFTGASPGYAQDGVNTWLLSNRRTGPSAFGALMGMADLGPFEIRFYARARMRLGNPRTGETHNDADYTQTVNSWEVGARSPYAICAGQGFAVALGDEGLYATEGGMGDERVFSQDLYDPTALEGRRGELEYAISACIAASESNSDAYRLHASLEGTVLYVRYWSSASATQPDREVRYDFSEGRDRKGMAALFRGDNRPHAWSPPQTVAPSCSATVPTALGVRRFGALDTNAGTANGRVDRLDTGTEDNGSLIQPVGYTGTLVPEGNERFQPLNFGCVARKAGAGIVLGVSRDSRRDHDEMEWDEVQVPTSSGFEYDRNVLPLPSGGREVRDAITVRITDDGSAEAPEVSRVTLYGDPQDVNYGKGTR